MRGSLLYVSTVVVRVRHQILIFFWKGRKMKVHMFGLIAAAFVWILASCAFAGSINTALQFDGSNDFVSVSDNDALSPQIVGEITTSAWVKMDVDSLGGVVLAKGASSQGWEYAIGIWPDGRATFTIWTPGGGVAIQVAGGVITPGQWYNITGTYEQGTATVYLNGNLVDQSDSFTPPIANGSGKLCFGKEDHAVHPWNYKGAIDEVSLWNYAKTGVEVQQLFSTTLSGTEQGLVAYWNFNEGSGQVVTDITGHGYNGILGTSSAIDSADPTWVAGVPEPITLILLGLGGVIIRKRR